MKIKKIEVFPIRVKNNFDIGRKSDTKNINTAMLEIKNLKKTKKRHLRRIKLRKEI
ncbi:MAG: hypothetical protein CM15mP129_05950 [Chloroflexota bacterium]|nr:MAG: hypothetical protein CM15mP129_05950 [Chloroflexota bacterium]